MNDFLKRFSHLIFHKKFAGVFRKTQMFLQDFSWVFANGSQNSLLLSLQIDFQCKRIFFRKEFFHSYESYIIRDYRVYISSTM